MTDKTLVVAPMVEDACSEARNHLGHLSVIQNDSNDHPSKNAGLSKADFIDALVKSGQKFA